MVHLIVLAGNMKYSDKSSSSIILLNTDIHNFVNFSDIVILSNLLTQNDFLPLNSRISIIKVPEITSGALATAAFGLSRIPANEPFIIVPSNSHIQNAGVEHFYKAMLERDPVVGAIVFNSIDPLYSYARLDKSGAIIEIVEKKISGSCALAGVYYFKSKSAFLECLKWAMVSNIQNEGKFFISPALNYFLANSIEISLFSISQEDYLRY